MTTILSIDVGIKNLSFCILKSSPDTTTIDDWKNIEVFEGNIKKLPIEVLTENIIQSLMQHFDENSNIDVVLIENQPMLKNGLMKTVAVVIFTFFNMMKIQFGNVQCVKFISATNKLKCTLAERLTKEGFKNDYKDRKRLSIELAKLYIPIVCPSKLEWFSNQKKKDDCADCLTQGIYYIEHVLKNVIS
jgi:hypothetical protein